MKSSITNAYVTVTAKIMLAAHCAAEKLRLLFLEAIAYLFAPTEAQRKRCHGASHTIEILIAIIIVVVIGAAVITLFKDTIVDIWNNKVKPAIENLFTL